jgi:DNA invertase Pin-like site-specific DNA recombinase
VEILLHDEGKLGSFLTRWHRWLRYKIAKAGLDWPKLTVSLNTLAMITDRKAGFRSLSDTWADTTSAHGRLMLTVLGGLAEFERELIRARTGEGRARAKARGVKMGRPFKMTPHQIQEALRRRNNGEPMRDIARSYNVSHSTISRLVV